MTRDETKQLIFAIQSIYQNFNPKDMAFTIDVWASILEEDDFTAIRKALKEYSRSNLGGFAPTPAQLIALTKKDSGEQGITGQEAWSLVMNAMRNSAYNSVSEFAKLPPLVQRAVGSADRLRQLAITEDLNQQVEMSLFINTYNQLKEKDRQEQANTPALEGSNNDTRRLGTSDVRNEVEIRRRLPDGSE